MSKPTLCVFCGSRPGREPAYLQAAYAVGEALGRAGANLVYGGAAHGLMGAVADGAIATGAEVQGVVPRGLLRAEFPHPKLGALHVVESMHERKALMHEKAAGFLTLPGGFGSMDELFETLTWAQLGHHRKPVGLLDTRGFYRPLLDWISHGVREGFVAQDQAQDLLVFAEPEPLVRAVLARASTGG